MYMYRQIVALNLNINNQQLQSHTDKQLIRHGWSGLYVQLTTRVYTYIHVYAYIRTRRHTCCWPLPQNMFATSSSKRRGMRSVIVQVGTRAEEINPRVIVIPYQIVPPGRVCVWRSLTECNVLRRRLHQHCGVPLRTSQCLGM